MATKREKYGVDNLSEEIFKLSLPVIAPLIIASLRSNPGKTIKTISDEPCKKKYYIGNQIIASDW